MDTVEENAYVAGTAALLWGYPLICHARAGMAGARAGAVRVNAFRRFTELKTAADRYVVTPNNVTLDCYGTFDVRAEPAVVHVPPLREPRWYLVQIGDYFDEASATSRDQGAASRCLRHHRTGVPG